MALDDPRSGEIVVTFAPRRSSDSASTAAADRDNGPKALIAPVGLRHMTRVPRRTSAVSMLVGLQAPPST